MKSSNLQKVMAVICAFAVLIGPKLPETAFLIVIGIWPCVLLFDLLDNRGRSRMVMFDGQES